MTDASTVEVDEVTYHQYTVGAAKLLLDLNIVTVSTIF